MNFSNKDWLKQSLKFKEKNNVLQ